MASPPSPSRYGLPPDRQPSSLSSCPFSRLAASQNFSIADSADWTGKLQSPALKQLLAHMATEGSAAADPPKQTTTYLLYWRKPEEWGQLIYDWVRYSGSRMKLDRFGARQSDGTIAFMRSPAYPK